MAKKHHVVGLIQYHDIETGFWGITDEQGRQWQPIMLPEALQKSGLKARINLKEVNQVASAMMWGKPVQIEDYEILD
ncbi:MAG: hypothetical protein ACFB0B_06160 [Thermonemataceae bacterium]